jgi:hypothetical protein
MGFDKIYWAKINKLAKRYKAVTLLGGKCEKCGEHNIHCLDFHHIDSDKKEESINKLGSYRWSIIEKEISKCILLCSNCHNKLHYDNNITESGYKNNKKLFIEYKGINGCEKCGYNDSNVSLDFHHINEKEKDFMLGNITTFYYNIEDLSLKITNEINKCVILCKNCHRLEHIDIDFFEKNKDVIIKESEKLKEKQAKINRFEVKKMLNNGIKQKDIAIYFNASKGTISNIIKEIKYNPKY